MDAPIKGSITATGLVQFVNFLQHLTHDELRNYNYYATGSSLGGRRLPLSYDQAIVLIYLARVDLTKDPTADGAEHHIQGLEGLLKAEVEGDLGFPLITIKDGKPMVTDDAVKKVDYIAVPK